MAFDKNFIPLPWESYALSKSYLELGRTQELWTLKFLNQETQIILVNQRNKNVIGPRIISSPCLYLYSTLITTPKKMQQNV